MPDPRHAVEVIVDGATGLIRPLAVTDLYDLVAGMVLGDTVPQAVRSQFDLARNAFVYSYFVYELTTTAEQQAYGALELALRTKITMVDGERDGGGLKKLISVAHDRGWLDRSEFLIDIGGAAPISILEMAVDLRNNLAHGDTHLFPVGSHDMIKLVWHAIDALFR